MTGYFQSTTDNPWNYLKTNFFLDIRQFGIANILSDVPFPKIFNGSLWTLTYELKCYLLIAILGVLGILTNYKNLILNLFLFLWLIFILDSVIPGTASKIIPYFADINLLKFLIYFLAGCIYFVYRKNILINKRIFFFSIILIIIGIQNNFYSLIAPFTLPYILFWLAFELPFNFNNFDKYGDLSYGMYIYAFPIQQSLAFYGLNKAGFTIYFILSMLLTIIPALLSYYLIEKPCLKLKYVQIPKTKLLFKR